jgi:membrane-bound inhibitor of C-type lysozyme
MKKILLLLGLLILLVVVGVWYNSTQDIRQGPKGEGKEVSYVCNEEKTIDATFYKGETVPGNPPIPGGSVHVVLSDGRVLDLKQTISADGVRYSDGDPSVEGGETFVFWSKGNGALVLENNEEKSYIGCAEVSKGDEFPNVYSDVGGLFTIRYPDGYTVDPMYEYQLGPSAVIPGVKFTIPKSLSEGTNLGSDSYLSVELLPGAPSCSANLFLDGTHETSTIKENGTTYSVASASNAGAGNRYEETVYALPGTSPCMAIRYLIHYSVFQNYEPGTVKEFDMDAVLQEFDQIRRGLEVRG